MSDTGDWLEICPSDAVAEGGVGHRFKVVYNTEETSAFIVRVDNEVHAFVNRCSHVPVELDWNYGEFLDDSGRIIVCATHGASYDGSTGHCLGGPCSGNPLVPVNVKEHAGLIYFKPEGLIQLSPNGLED